MMYLELDFDMKCEEAQVIDKQASMTQDLVRPPSKGMQKWWNEKEFMRLR
jgi:hypothetical protein